MAEQLGRTNMNCSCNVSLSGQRKRDGDYILPIIIQYVASRQQTLIECLVTQTVNQRDGAVR